jgi:hypothetical protein
MADLFSISLVFWFALTGLGLAWTLASVLDVARWRWRRARLRTERRRDLPCARRLLAIRACRSGRSQRPAAADAALPPLPAADAGMGDRRWDSDAAPSSSLSDDLASRLMR